MNKLRYYTLLLVSALVFSGPGQLFSQTVIPNGDFESWVVHSNYSNPAYWDSPDSILMTIPIFGQNVVFKSTDHYSGSFSVKLITKEIAIPGASFNCPGVITLGKIDANIITQTFSITGGVPINDRPTHLMGYYKFSPVGGDSCVVGIILYKSINGNQDTIAAGYFSAKNATSDWTHFSAWINYDTILTPDTMNIVALSSAQMDMHPNTTMYLDGLYLDYTVGIDGQDPASGISVYQDKETGRLIIFCEFSSAQNLAVRLYNLSGQEVYSGNQEAVTNSRIILPYSDLTRGLYILSVQHDGKTFTKKFLLGFN
jgi:hypothetical protein